MPDYLIEFTAHIDETRRPKDANFPKEVFVREVYSNLDTQEQIKALYNQRVKQLISQSGIVVFLDESKIIQSELNFDQRVYIPWHMITYFQGRVQQLIPQPVPEIPLEAAIPEPLPPDPNDKKRLPN